MWAWSHVGTNARPVRRRGDWWSRTHPSKGFGRRSILRSREGNLLGQPKCNPTTPQSRGPDDTGAAGVAWLIALWRGRQVRHRLWQWRRDRCARVRERRIWRAGIPAPHRESPRASPLHFQRSQRPHPTCPIHCPTWHGIHLTRTGRPCRCTSQRRAWTTTNHVGR